MLSVYFFFFQAEDGIRDKLVTGVQTCALPISRQRARAPRALRLRPAPLPGRARRPRGPRDRVRPPPGRCGRARQLLHRSEEHTSELQSLAYLVCRLLLEKKKKIQKTDYCVRPN